MNAFLEFAGALFGAAVILVAGPDLTVRAWAWIASRGRNRF